MDTIGFHNLLIERRTFFCFSGALSESVLSSITEAVKHQVFTESGEKKLGSRVFAVFIEQVQNIIRYSAESFQSDSIREVSGLGTVAISATTEGFTVEAVNPIDENSVASLDENLSQLKVLTSEQLKAAYTDRLKQGPPKDSKGAGLGFIDMARKGDGFEYSFIKSGGITHFIFSVKINSQRTA